MSLILHRSRAIARLLIVAVLLNTLPLGAAQAALVSTEEALAAAEPAEARARLMGLLQRDEVRLELEALGVDPAEAEARIARLTDAEIAAVAGRLKELPAGEGALGAVVGAALFIFLVLLITDLLGLTDVFPFVRR